MLKRLNTALCLIVLAVQTQAQITITAADVPVLGDTIRYSRVDALTPINYTATGTNYAWDFSGLTPFSQRIDTYKTAAAVNPIYGATIRPTAYGIKVEDTLDLGGSGGPVTVTEVYSFFNKKTLPSSRFIIEAFAAKVNGIPT